MLTPGGAAPRLRSPRAVRATRSDRSNAPGASQHEGGRERVRTPVIMQLEATDCGAACLGIVLAHWGRWVSFEDLREECNVGRDGSNAKDILAAARRYGLEAKGWSREVHQLARMSFPFPVILFWGFNHFVVLEGIDSENQRFFLNDPATGHRVVDQETFEREWTGVVLTCAPGPTFEPGGTAPPIWRQLWTWIRDFRTTLTFATLCGLLRVLPLLALPIFLALFVDHVLINGQRDWGASVVVAMVAAGGLTYLLSWLQMRSLRNLAIHLSIRQSDRYITRLLRLPMAFYARRYSGDLAVRLQLIDQISELGASQLVGLAIELVMSLAFLVLIFAYDLPVALTVAALAVLCVLSMRVVVRLRKDESHKLRREQGMFQGVAMAGLRTIDSIRATAREDDFFSRWSGRQANELRARQRFMELGHATHAVPGLFQLLGAAAVVGVGGWRVSSGDMTVGSLMACFVLAESFLAPISRLVQCSDAIETLGADLKRLDDVFNAREDSELEFREGAAAGEIVTFSGRMKLVGRLEMKDVTFGFQRNRPPVLQNFNLTLEPGQRVAIVGPSGSGKSSLALLAAGVYRPWSGEILYDGAPRSEIPREVFSTSVSTVDQSAMLFAASVRDNITMWNGATPDEQIIEAAQDADIHDEIIARPLGYDSLVEERGRNFSGGQRLRIEIARALVDNPALLILDEATSALDTLTELRVDDNLRRRNCACLIVAHRLSTIRDADRIIVLDQGRVVEEGTHEELIVNEDGYYGRFLHGQ